MKIKGWDIGLLFVILLIATVGTRVFYMFIWMENPINADTCLNAAIQIITITILFWCVYYMTGNYYCFRISMILTVFPAYIRKISSVISSNMIFLILVMVMGVVSFISVMCDKLLNNGKNSSKEKGTEMPAQQRKNTKTNTNTNTNTNSGMFGSFNFDNITINVNEDQPVINPVQPVREDKPVINPVKTDDDMVKPEVNNVQPEVDTAKPEVNSVQPEVDAVKQDIDTVKPEFDRAKPVKYIENPLLLPKRREHREMDFAIELTPYNDDFDIKVLPEGDDFDIK